MEHSKRTLQVNVRLTAEDLELMRKAADQNWPGVPLSNSTLLLTLAHNQAQQMIQGHARPKKTKNR